MIENLRPRLDRLQFSTTNQREVIADVLRLDLIHPVVSGNKWFKLKEYLKEAKEQEIATLLSFGGPYSNHIVALAAAAKNESLSAIGIIRGEQHHELSPSLKEAQALGMQLFFISRSDYRQKIVPPVVHKTCGSFYIINEGGYGALGAKGAQQILCFEGAESYTHILTAVGTGTTLAGLTAGTSDQQQVIGISVLKNNFNLSSTVAALLIPGMTERFQILHQYHLGGYARLNETLIRFMNEWFECTGIPSDFVYTAKLFFAFKDLLTKGFFPQGSRVLLVHSGGLQGNCSLPKGTLIF